MKTLQKTIAIGILIVNIYFVYMTVEIIRTSGGPMGWGLLVLPFTIGANLLLIPAVLSLQKRFENNNFLMVVNALGLLGILFLVFLVVF